MTFRNRKAPSKGVVLLVGFPHYRSTIGEESVKQPAIHRCSPAPPEQTPGTDPTSNTICIKKGSAQSADTQKIYQKLKIRGFRPGPWAPRGPDSDPDPGNGPGVPRIGLGYF